MNTLPEIDSSLGQAATGWQDFSTNEPVCAMD
jgi:hypothetical protein